MKIIARSVTLALGLSVCGISGYLLYLLLKKDDDDDYTDTLSRSSKFKILEVPVHKDMVKVLIGRGGKNIKLIQEQSNTRINFKEREGQQEAICVIRGTIEACNIAENLVQEFVNNQPVLECEDVYVPQGCIARIIGRDGDRIREICCKSGAKVTVDDNRGAVNRRVSIKGTREQIVVAKSLIEEIVEQSHKTQVQIEASLAKREPRLPPKASESPKPVESPKVERISPVPGQPDAQFEVYVSAMVDPSRFWLQIVGPKATELDVLVEEMTEYYRKQENRESHILNKVTKGDLVAAVFQYDSKWYRAEVLSLSDDNPPQAELYYVDYGDTDLVPVEELYELRTDFLRLHFQAIECFLARVDPVGESWSVEAVDKFEEWTHVAQWKKLSAKINGYCVREKTRAKREGSPVPGVDLFDVNGEKDVDIAQELVNQGFAVFKRDVDLRPSSRATSVSNISVASSS
ncbi:tudor and KH domain-containing protein homolog [Tribolium castaneum]|uniref:Tudor and KH domain-containing protein-like Protein n=1 Tax=Tribolium castaneum TaxID=7070 RepID=D6WUS2_TRICA|nr:PREDICTED: tudor and KH domain-containing protein [Tribolium castaneum]EFA09059.1 Tudor and KH domain-containing protein-like Protein [Tribolium castaneum]|eukprot:XP_973443.1 PREDICTED: tudor and KH domain-containing protein [Tribolium castaneum]